MFGSKGSVNGRAVGVAIPEGQLTTPGNGTPRTILHLVKLETYAAQWVDDDARTHSEVVQCMAGVWYKAPNGENYAATLKPLSKDHWFAKAADTKMAEQLALFKPVEVPESDAVDVLDEG